MTIRSLAAPLALAVSLVAGQAAAADLVLTMTGGGNVTSGQQRTFTINTGSVLLGLPPGLVVEVKLSSAATGFTASSISGAGWTCSNQTFSCTRTTGIAPGGTFPPITVTGAAGQAPGSYTMCFVISHQTNAAVQPDQVASNNSACVRGNIRRGPRDGRDPQS